MSDKSIQLTDCECVGFLREYLPQMGYRWKGFRKVRNQVCKRIKRRMKELQLDEIEEYKSYLNHHRDEWNILDSMCNITISRFYRDRGVYNTIRSEIFPILVELVSDEGEREIRCWSIGSGSGEEPYTLSIICKLEVESGLESDLDLKIIATETDPHLFHRAKEGRYSGGSLKQLPQKFKQAAFFQENGDYVLRENFKENIQFLRQDIRETIPEQNFHLVLCRNLAFTYFDQKLQSEILSGIEQKIVTGGFLVIGANEELPQVKTSLVPFKKSDNIYQKQAIE